MCVKLAAWIFKEHEAPPSAADGGGVEALARGGAVRVHSHTRNRRHLEGPAGEPVGLTKLGTSWAAQPGLILCQISWKMLIQLIAFSVCIVPPVSDKSCSICHISS